MTLLLVLIAIGVQRFLQILSQPFHFDWSGRYYSFCERKIEYVTKGHGLLGFAILVIPTLFVVTVVFTIIFHLLGYIGYSVFCLILLWYCIDARDLQKQPYPRIGPVNTLGKVYRDLFAMLFWFTVFGPVGLTLYYLVYYFNQYFHDNPSSESKELYVYSQKVLAVMDWVPERLFTFCFALVGHFGNVFKIWIKSMLGGLDPQLQLVSQCGQAVVKTTEDAVSLLNRVLIVWLVVIALVTIGLILG
jgi:membrane protein required for beta-lactamase induction